MEFFDHVKYLGMYWGEPSLQPLIDALGITKAPKLPKGDTDAYVEIKKSGLFLIFSDERNVNVPGKVFPEGALVLTNLTFYLAEKDGFKQFRGKLPRDVPFDSSSQMALALFGTPSNLKFTTGGAQIPPETYRVLRWDRKDFCLFLSFNDKQHAKDIALQLPLDQA